MSPIVSLPGAQLAEWTTGPETGQRGRKLAAASHPEIATTSEHTTLSRGICSKFGSPLASWKGKSCRTNRKGILFSPLEEKKKEKQQEKRIQTQTEKDHTSTVEPEPDQEMPMGQNTTARVCDDGTEHECEGSGPRRVKRVLPLWLTRITTSLSYSDPMCETRREKALGAKP